MSEQISNISGAYFSCCRLGKCSKEAEDKALALQLWEKSTTLLELDQEELGNCIL